MAVPKITETRCRGGSVQAKLIIQLLPIPTFPFIVMHGTLCSTSTVIAEPCHVGHYGLCIKKKCRDGVV